MNREEIYLKTNRRMFSEIIFYVDDFRGKKKVEKSFVLENIPLKRRRIEKK